MTQTGRQAEVENLKCRTGRMAQWAWCVLHKPEIQLESGSPEPMGMSGGVVASQVEMGSPDLQSLATTVSSGFD